MKLYEIAEEIRQFLQVMTQVAEENDGVLPVDAEEVLYKLEMDFGKKVENIACVIKNTQASIEALKAEEEKLKARRVSYEKQVDFLKSYLANHLEDKFESPKVVVSFRKSQAVEIDENSALDIKYCTVKEVITPDKKMIKEILSAGGTIDGAMLVERKNIIIK